MPDQWRVIAAVWLLAAWSPGGKPGWRSVAVPGKGPSRQDEQWEQPPPPDELAALGGFDGRPVAATILTSHTHAGPGTPYESPPREETVARVSELVGRLVAVPDLRCRRLLDLLAELLAGRYDDLLLVDAGDDGLHLVQRDTWGNTLRLSLLPAPEVEPPPTIEADGSDAALRTRVACLVTLLSKLLWASNNEPVMVRLRIEPFTGDLAAAARRRMDLRNGDGYDDEEPSRFRPLTEAALREAMRAVVVGGLWDDDVPPDHIAMVLATDLLDAVLDRMRGPDGRTLELAYTGFLPGVDEDNDDEQGCVLIRNGQELAVLDIEVLV